MSGWCPGLDCNRIRDYNSCITFSHTQVFVVIGRRRFYASAFMGLSFLN